jgi:hypothetical protein
MDEEDMKSANEDMEEVEDAPVKEKKQRGRKSQRSAEESAALRVKRTFLYGFRTTLKKDGFTETSSSNGVYVLQRGNITITCYLDKDKVEISVAK